MIRPSARVLVVDDDPSMRVLLEGMLKASGYQTATANGGAQALTLLDQGKYDLVLTDKNMSGIDGHTLINEICMRHPRTGTVMITGYRTEESERMAQHQHVLGYIEKPFFDLYTVLHIVEAALVEQRRRIGTLP